MPADNRVRVAAVRWWPFGSRKVETRQSQGGAGYTDAVVRALLETAAGGVVADPAATAALEAAAGVYARAFAVAEVQPMTASTAALTAPCLALMARDLIRRGEHVAAIEVDALRHGAAPPGGILGRDGRR